MKRLRIIDSTTITLFSNVIFKDVGRHPKTGKKKGGIKVHSVIHANEGVHCDVRFTSAATNDFDMSMETVVAIYRWRWQIESLFKQIKQNFPLRYLYGESANAIKIQIWVTLIANLLLSLLQISLKRRWSFSGLATMVRIVMMEYLNMNNCFNMPDADMKMMLENAAESPPNGEDC